MARRGRPKHPDILTPREWEVLALLREGRTNEEIAERLGVSHSTARFHVSEILGKLGVSSREEAARWRPEQRERRSWLLAPLGLLRRSSPLGAGAQVAGAGVLAIALAGVALLAWGVIASGSGSGWRIEGGDTDYTSVILFDVNARVARRLPIEWDAPHARWVKAGETFLAGSGHSYGVYSLDGRQRFSPLTQGDLTRDVVPAPDGSSVLVGRTDDQYIVSTLPNSGGGPFLSRARELAFSPDGAHAAWVGLGRLDQENNVHPSRTVFVSTKHQSTGLNGGGMAVQWAFEDESLIDLAPQPWSRDSKYLLVERRARWCELAACESPPDFEVYNTTGVSGDQVWAGYEDQLSSAAWAGLERLLIRFRDGTRDSDFPEARSLLIGLFDGTKLALPDLLDASCCLSFSPDGRYVVARVASGSDDRCAIFDTETPEGEGWRELAAITPGPADAGTGFCEYADWTPDATMAIVSASTED